MFLICVFRENCNCPLINYNNVYNDHVVIVTILIYSIVKHKKDRVDTHFRYLPSLKGLPSIWVLVTFPFFNRSAYLCSVPKV